MVHIAQTEIIGVTFMSQLTNFVVSGNTKVVFVLRTTGFESTKNCHNACKKNNSHRDTDTNFQTRWQTWRFPWILKNRYSSSVYINTELEIGQLGVDYEWSFYNDLATEFREIWNLSSWISDNFRWALALLYLTFAGRISLAAISTKKCSRFFLQAFLDRSQFVHWTRFTMTNSRRVLVHREFPHRTTLGWHCFRRTVVALETND